MARWQNTAGTQNQIYHAMWHVVGVNTVKGFKTKRYTRFYDAPIVHPHTAAVFEGPPGSQSCQMVNMMVDGQMAKHRRDPKPNIPRDVACLGCQHRKRIQNIKVHTALRCANSARPHRSRFRGAGRKSVMPNGQHDG